jgi:hypothetical protein
MARLSDFQTAPLVRNLEAERLLLANAGRVHRNLVDWRAMRVVSTEGGVACYGKDAIEQNARRNRFHSALDRMLSRLNKTEDDAPRLHAALDRLLDSDSEKAPEASDSDEAEDEVIEDDSEENPDPNTKTTIPYDKNHLASLDALQRTLDKTLGLDDASVISPRREIKHNTAYITDSQFIAQHLDPNLSCVEAANKLSDISYKRQANDANRGYWSGLFYFLRSQPKGSRIRDIENRACLSTLLAHTVGGMKGVFGV